jgi:tetratricopeptide (TPR) repeat protein
MPLRPLRRSASLKLECPWRFAEFLPDKSCSILKLCGRERTVGKGARQRRQKQNRDAGSPRREPQVPARGRNNSQKAQAEAALSRLLEGNSPGRVSLAGAYAFGYGELGLSQREGTAPEWYDDLDPLETLFLGTVWPQAFHDHFQFANACTAWFRLLRRTPHWTGIECFVHEALDLSEAHDLPVDAGELMLLLAGRLEAAGLDRHKLPRRSLPEEALRNARLACGPARDFELPEPPADAVELIARLKEPAELGPPHDGTVADALRVGLGMMATTGMDFLRDDPMSLLVALYTALVAGKYENAYEAGDRSMAWALGLDPNSPLVPITDTILVAMTRDLDVDTTLGHLLAVPEFSEYVPREDCLWHSSLGTALEKVAFELGYQKLILRDRTILHLDEPGVSAMRLLQRQFQEKFGRPPGPDDPLFFDPDADEPQPIALAGPSDPMFAMLKAATICPAWLYAYQHTNGLLPRFDGGFANERDRSEWCDVVSDYQRVHQPDNEVDHDAETLKLQSILVGISLHTAADDPQCGASLAARLMADSVSDEHESAILALYLDAYEDDLISQLRSDPAILDSACEYAMAWAGTDLAGQVEMLPDLEDDIPYAALLAVAVAVFQKSSVPTLVSPEPGGERSDVRVTSSDVRVSNSQILQEIRTGRDSYTSGRDLTVINNNFVATANQSEVLGLLPRDTPYFTGRQAELDLLIALAERRSVIVAAIDGAVGVGKTALAIHAAHRLLPRFPDGHLYADLCGYTDGQSPAESGEVLEVLLRRMRVPAEGIPVGLEERAALLRHLLADRRVLIVLDNAASEAQVRPLLPGTGSSMVMITSRIILAGLEVDQRIDLDVLPDDDALELLVTLIGPQRIAGEDPALHQVRELCGGLPLALRIAGQLLAIHPQWPVSRLAGMLVDERSRLDRLAVGDRQVRTAFMVSYKSLSECDARAFRLLGLHPGPDFDVLAAASLADIEPEAMEPILERLQLVHLIVEQHSGQFRMHDLLRLFALQTCHEFDDQTGRDAALVRLVNHYIKLASFLTACLHPELLPEMTEDAGQDGGRFPSPRKALAWFESEQANMLGVLRLAEDRGWYDQVWWLAMTMGDPLVLLRKLDVLIVARQSALMAARKMRRVSAEADALVFLGDVYADVQEFSKAIACYDEAIELFRKLDDRHGEGQALNCFGIAYRAQGNLGESIRSYENSLGIFRDIGDRRSEGMVLGNLGVAFLQSGRTDESARCCQEALTIISDIGGPHNEAVILGNLGEVYVGLGRVEDGVNSFRRAIAIFDDIGDLYNLALAFGNLGRAYIQLKKFKDASDCHRAARDIFIDVGDKNGEAESRRDLARAQFLQHLRVHAVPTSSEDL